MMMVAFPALGWWPLAWVGLIPWLIALDGKTPAQGFRIGYLCGFMVFMSTLYWLFHITEQFSVIAGVGVVALMMYLALYYAAFGWFYCRFQNRSSLVKLLVLPSFWCVLEWIRAHFLSGFDWISLGHSQYQNLYSIQIADFAGVFGVSFMVCLSNVFFKHVLAKPRQHPRYSPLAYVVFVILMAAHLGYGAIRLAQEPSQKKVIVGVVQGNIEQEMKWAEFAWPMIMNGYRQLTLKVAQQNPDLIIWPETSFPGILGEDDVLFDQIIKLAGEVQTPILLGAIENRKGDYHNTVLLMQPTGQINLQYDKMHLVPFGEYLPGRDSIGPLADLVPIMDFTAGQNRTIFNAAGQYPFSVLICFEDTVSKLARPFVLQGSKLLINMTNDAWFKESKAATLHLASSLFRAVENRRTLIRSANTGVSGVIDPYGRILNRVMDATGRTIGVAGSFVQEVDLNDEISVYTRYGNVFVFVCFGCILGGLVSKRRINTLPN